MSSPEVKLKWGLSTFLISAVFSCVTEDVGLSCDFLGHFIKDSKLMTVPNQLPHSCYLSFHKLKVAISIDVSPKHVTNRFRFSKVLKLNTFLIICNQHKQWLNSSEAVIGY